MPVTVTMPDEEIAMLARELAWRRGVSEIETVREALRRALEESDRVAERRQSLDRAESAALEDAMVQVERLKAEVAELRFKHLVPWPSDVDRRLRAMETISNITAALPVLDNRTADEILGHDEILS